MKLFLVSSFLLLLCCSAAIAKKKFEGDFEFVDEDNEKMAIRKPILEKKKWIHDPTSDLCRPLNCKKRELCLLEDAYTAVCVPKKDLHKSRIEVQQQQQRTREQPDEDQSDDGGDTNSSAGTEVGDIGGAIISSSSSNSNSNDGSGGEKIQMDLNTSDELSDDVFYESDIIEPDEETCTTCPVTKPTFLCGSDNRTYSSICRMDYHNCIHKSAVKQACEGFCPCKSSKQNKLAERQKNFLNKYKMTIKKEEVKKNQLSEKHKVRGYNEVLDKSTNKYAKASRLLSKQVECKPQQLTAIGNRLLDWFSVIMVDSKTKRQHGQKSKARFPPACKTEAKWMFGHMDLNNDGSLSTQELYDLEHDQNERCIKPFLDSCDMDQEKTINPREWCRCFEKTDRPCAAVRRRLRSDLMGSYVPECDMKGFYKPTQCHNSVGVCWCVDKHGVEFANTRTRSIPNCGEVITNAASITSDDEDDERDEDDSAEGSADNVLLS